MLSLKGVTCTVCCTSEQKEVRHTPVFKHLEYIMSQKNEFLYPYSNKD